MIDGLFYVSGNVKMKSETAERETDQRNQLDSIRLSLKKGAKSVPYGLPRYDEGRCNSSGLFSCQVLLVITKNTQISRKIVECIVEDVEKALPTNERTAMANAEHISILKRGVT